MYSTTKCHWCGEYLPGDFRGSVCPNCGRDEPASGISDHCRAYKCREGATNTGYCHDHLDGWAEQVCFRCGKKTEYREWTRELLCQGCYDTVFGGNVKYYGNCPRCGGDGLIVEAVLPWGPEKINCPVCNGSGSI